MPDLFAHALLTYALATALSWRVGWIDRRHVTMAMVGAFLPDLTKAYLVIPSWRVETLLGLPFDWRSLGTGGGTLLSVLAGVVFAGQGQRRRVGAMLGLGAGSHLLADSLLLTPSGRTKQLLWPLVQYRVPSPGIYQSTEPWPTVAAAVLAAAVWGVSRYRAGSVETATGTGAGDPEE